VPQTLSNLTEVSCTNLSFGAMRNSIEVVSVAVSPAVNTIAALCQAGPSCERCDISTRPLRGYAV